MGHTTTVTVWKPMTEGDTLKANSCKKHKAKREEQSEHALRMEIKITTVARTNKMLDASDDG